MPQAVAVSDLRDLHVCEPCMMQMHSDHGHQDVFARDRTTGTD